jgi:ABC-type multidrug transport system permease subunit
VLPFWLQGLSRLLPITYAIPAMEPALHKGAGFAELKTELLTLSIFAFALAPLSAAAFNFSLRKARKDGTLGQY